MNLQELDTLIKSIPKEERTMTTRAYGLIGQINTYKDYCDCMEAYNFTPMTYNQWVTRQEETDAKFCKEWPREFKWTKETA